MGSSVSTKLELGSDGRPLHEPEGSIFPNNSHESDKTAKKLLTGLQREMTSRFQDRPLLLEDLKGLGMAGILSDDGQHLTMAFEDVHRLVTAMRMAEAILNERVQNSRKAKIAQIKTQLGAELERAKQALTQKHSFHSIGAFEAYAQDFEGGILLETMIIARAVTWLANFPLTPMRKPEEARFRFSQNSERPIRVSELSTSCIFIITMRSNFLKREFVAQYTILETGSQKLLSPQPAALLQSDRKLQPN